MTSDNSHFTLYTNMKSFLHLIVTNWMSFLFFVNSLVVWYWNCKTFDCKAFEKNSQICMSLDFVFMSQTINEQNIKFFLYILINFMYKAYMIFLIPCKWKLPICKLTNYLNKKIILGIIVIAVLHNSKYFHSSKSLDIVVHLTCRQMHFDSIFFCLFRYLISYW